MIPFCALALPNLEVDLKFPASLPYPLAQLSSVSLRLGAKSNSMSLGTEWVIDATGCDAAALASIEQLRAVFDRVIRDLNLHVIGDVAWHQFSSPGGVSGIALLSESHLTCHTYPEFRAATFNLYCCRDRSTWPWEEMLTELLGATTVSVRAYERLIHLDEPVLEELGQWSK